MIDSAWRRTFSALDGSGYARRSPASNLTNGAAGGVDLAAGEARYPLPGPVRAELGTAVADLDLLGYGHPTGDLRLRAAFLQHLLAGASTRDSRPPLSAGAGDPDQVLVTAGGKEAAALALRYLLNQHGGHGLLLPKPGWEPYRIWAAGFDVPVMPYSPAAFAADPNLLRTLARGQQRPSVLVLNYPHNPTGVTIDQASLNQLLATASELGMAVLSDEVYRWFGPKPVSAMFAPAYDPRTHLIVDSTSKWLTTAGLRVGFLVGRCDVISNLSAFRGTYASGTSVVDQRLAHQLLSSPAATGWLAEVRLDVDRVRDETVKLLAELGVVVLSHGGLYVWCNRDLGHPGVLQDAPSPAPALLTPGDGFGSPGRVRLCTARAGLEPAEAAAAVFAALRGPDA
ncbi:pyridoxal phosphate-dependent aminotransferase [Dactylosporangium sp. NPDC050688]|uniref:pyridoxal phosphate-dependent aminotransferase n=1 Tax=Dactylosporangium sp. NPDC050688 TaxID=3157217 RepID=UPI0033FC4650